jgi:hypothetical protein
MKHISILLILGLCAALMANCSSSPTPIPTPQPTDTPAPTATPVDSPNRHYELSGGFSYVPPSGLELVESSRIQYKIAREPAAEDFAGNMNVVDEEFRGSLDAYVTTSVENMSTYFEGFRQISQDEFQPAEGPPGVRLVVENVQSGRTLHQVFYFFGAAERKFVVACTRLAEAGEEFDVVCEESVKTFRIESE